MEFITGKITIKHILQHNNNWGRFYSKHKHRIRDSIIENIEKLLLCRTQELGFHKYQCPHCGECITVPHSCKSRICSSCGKSATDRWIEANLPQFPNVSYQHLVFTLPEELRSLILLNRKLFLNALFQYAAFTVRVWAVTDRGYIPGIVMVLHTFGRDLKFNPHIHMLVTCGGLSCDYSTWIDNFFIPHQALKSIWRYHIVSFIRSSIKKKALVLPLFLRHNPNNFLNTIYSKIWYVSLGRRLPEASFTIIYIGRYTKRPVIAEGRIIEYDGTFVLFHYEDRATSKTLYVRLTVDEFIARFIRHIPDKGFRQIRYAGIFAPRVRSKLIPRVKSMFKKIRKSANIFMSNLQTYSLKMAHCPRCGCEMILIAISNHGKYFQISQVYTSHPP